MNKSDELDRLDSLNKSDELDKLDSLNKSDKLDRLDSLKKSDELDRLNSLNISDELDKLDSLNKSDELDRLDEGICKFYYELYAYNSYLQYNICIHTLRGSFKHVKCLLQVGQELKVFYKIQESNDV